MNISLALKIISDGFQKTDSSLSSSMTRLPWLSGYYAGGAQVSYHLVRAFLCAVGNCVYCSTVSLSSYSLRLADHSSTTVPVNIPSNYTVRLPTKLFGNFKHTRVPSNLIYIYRTLAVLQLLLKKPNLNNENFNNFRFIFFF